MSNPAHMPASPARLRDRLRALAGAEGGMTLVEVVVAALMVGLIGMSLVGLEAAGRTTQDQRVRSQAVALAQQDQERMRGMNADQLAKLSETRTINVEGTTFRVTSTGTFVKHSGTDAAGCTDGAADYAKVVSSVTWDHNKRTPVVEQSVITPPAGGSVIAKAIDQNGLPLAGTAITVDGTDDNTDATRRTAVTDAGGCAVFGGLTVGDYDVIATRSGYVDASGDSTPTSQLTTTAGNTASTNFTLGLAGRLTASFSTTFNGVTYPGQQAPSLSWTNTGMPIPGTATPGSPATAIATATTATLFPFITGPSQYTGNYFAWAGRCSTAKPPTAPPPSPDVRPVDQRGLATVAPGATAATTTIGLPAMIVTVRFRTGASSSYSNVKPLDIRLDYPSAPSTSCGQSWHPPINTAAGPTAPSTGWLRFPGQPYGSNYTVCASYRPSSTTYRATATLNNTSYATTGNPILMSITGTSSFQGTC